MGSMDERVVRAPGVSAQQIERLGLPHMAHLVEEEYFVPLAVGITEQEREAYAWLAATWYADYCAALDEVLRGPFREEFGLSPKLWTLAAECWAERDHHPHSFGRFDVAGIVDDSPGHLIEFNADTATVLAEAALIQDVQIGREKTWNHLLPELADGLSAAAAARDPADRNVLVVTLGHPEDDDNARVWLRAAQQAGLYTELAHLPSVHFSEEGVYRQLGQDAWTRFGIVVKLFPWDWIDAEEPGLLDELAALIRSGQVLVLNPPYASLMQSKAMLAELHRRHRDEGRYLRAGWGPQPPKEDMAYVTKPIFGREGENVTICTAGHQRLAETGGSYDAQPRIWQALTQLPTDETGHTYQAGVYVAGGVPVALAWRRRDGPIVDEDSQFVAGFVA